MAARRNTQSSDIKFLKEITDQTIDLYEILGVTDGATTDQIRKAYKKKSKKLHPDRGGDEEQFELLQVAYRILTSDRKRRLYDNRFTATHEELKSKADSSAVQNDLADIEADGTTDKAVPDLRDNFDSKKFNEMFERNSRKDGKYTFKNVHVDPKKKQHYTDLSEYDADIQAPIRMFQEGSFDVHAFNRMFDRLHTKDGRKREIVKYDKPNKEYASSSLVKVDQEDNVLTQYEEESKNGNVADYCDYGDAFGTFHANCQVLVQRSQ